MIDMRSICRGHLGSGAPLRLCRKDRGLVPISRGGSHQFRFGHAPQMTFTTARKSARSQMLFSAARRRFRPTWQTPRSGLLSMFRRRAARTGLDGSKTADPFRNTTGPQWTKKEERLICVFAGQPPLDVARPKGLEPLTF